MQDVITTLTMILLFGGLVIAGIGNFWRVTAKVAKTFDVELGMAWGHRIRVIGLVMLGVGVAMLFLFTGQR